MRAPRLTQRRPSVALPQQRAFLAVVQSRAALLSDIDGELEFVCVRDDLMHGGAALCVPPLIGLMTSGAGRTIAVISSMSEALLPRRARSSWISGSATRRAGSGERAGTQTSDQALPSRIGVHESSPAPSRRTVRSGARRSTSRARSSQGCAARISATTPNPSPPAVASRDVAPAPTSQAVAQSTPRLSDKR